MNALTDIQLETLATLACDTSGIFENRSFHERMLIGSERIRSLMLQSEYPEELRILVIAPCSDHGWWDSPKYREHQTIEDVDLPVKLLGSHKASPFDWNQPLLQNRDPGVWVISWESMRGSIPAKHRSPGNRLLTRDVEAAMHRGTIPPWHKTGIWDLVIAEDAHHMAFRNTLQRKVLRMVKARNKLALSDNTSGSHPEGLWGVLNWLWPDRYPGFWKWAKDCFEIEEIKRARFTECKFKGEKMPGCSWFDVPCAVRNPS